ncbi:type I-E CRISPR-associated protein Cse1/CasA [Aeromonas enteropelogenes]|uniref:type I-E CRISPR-associated protein Cse1/CasA n=1 Tax=Aeromonas enteropelogenes TaxID=29489 RepID=UPI003BA1AEE7
MSNCFNLVDEPWIPVANVGRVGLADLFTCPDYLALGGNSVQKAAVMKLLQAVVQAATTPRDLAEWQALGWQGMAERVCSYLARWHGRFYLYGERPFLQMPAIAPATIRGFGAIQPDVATGNTTVLTQRQAGRTLDDGGRALLLLTQMGFALGGKKTDNSVVLTPGYRGKSNDRGKPSTGRPGPSVAHLGMLHHYFLAPSLLESVWLNLFTEEDINGLTMYPNRLGQAPWEQMPEGEDCKTARALKGSLMGRLIPLSRFCLLVDEGMHYSEGIAHDNYKEGIFDPSVAIDSSGKEARVYWADPEQHPWRELNNLLGFIGKDPRACNCIQLRLALPKIDCLQLPVAVWSGGLRVSSNAGEQYASGADDMVESLCWLQPRHLKECWLSDYRYEMDKLDKLARLLYGGVTNYFKIQLVEGTSYARQASHLFWQRCEHHCRVLLDSCDDVAACQRLRQQFVLYASQVFDQICPHHRLRQLDAWARTKPDFAACLKKE